MDEQDRTVKFASVFSVVGPALGLVWGAALGMVFERLTAGIAIGIVVGSALAAIVMARVHLRTGTMPEAGDDPDAQVR